MMQVKILAVLLAVLALGDTYAADSANVVLRFRMEDTAGYTVRFFPPLSNTHTTIDGYSIYTCKIPYDERCLVVFRDPSIRIMPPYSACSLSSSSSGWPTSPAPWSAR